MWHIGESDIITQAQTYYCAIVRTHLPGRACVAQQQNQNIRSFEKLQFVKIIQKRCRLMIPFKTKVLKKKSLRINQC